MTWTETGGPLVKPPVRTGFSTRVIRLPIVYELEGKVDLEFEAQGVRCRIKIPLDRVVAA